MVLFSKDDATQELKEISAYAGSRIDLVQSGGGNTSAKASGNVMYIKASGFKLKDLVEEKGIACVNCIPITQDSKYPDPGDFSEWNKRCVNSNKQLRPSIEVSMHALLGNVVLHTHPVLVIAFLCVENSHELIDRIFHEQVKYLYVPYAKPGIELGILLMEKLKTAALARPSVIFLENHGIVIDGNTALKLLKLMKKY